MPREKVLRQYESHDHGSSTSRKQTSLLQLRFNININDTVLYHNLYSQSCLSLQDFSYSDCRPLQIFAKPQSSALWTKDAKFDTIMSVSMNTLGGLINRKRESVGQTFQALPHNVAKPLRRRGGNIRSRPS
jgi:hypothetical protein